MNVHFPQRVWVDGINGWHSTEPSKEDIARRAIMVTWGDPIADNSVPGGIRKKTYRECLEECKKALKSA